MHRTSPFQLLHGDPCAGLSIAVACRVGLEVPRVEVRFRNLRVSTEVNVGSRALPTLPNYVRDVTEVSLYYIFADRFVQFVRILSKLQGTIYLSVRDS